MFTRSGVEQSVARKAHNLEVVGSSPTPATQTKHRAPVAGIEVRSVGRRRGETEPGARSFRLRDWPSTLLSGRDGRSAFK